MNEPTINWPVKVPPQHEVGLDNYTGVEQISDCPACPLFRECPGDKPLSPDTAPPPCKTYTSYTEWRNSIKIKDPG